MLLRVTTVFLFSIFASLVSAADVASPETTKAVKKAAAFCVSFMRTGQESPQPLLKVGFTKKMRGYRKPGNGNFLKRDNGGVSVSAKKNRVMYECPIWIDGGGRKRSAVFFEAVKNAAIKNGYKPRQRVRTIGKSRKIKEIVYEKSGVAFTIRGSIKRSSASGASVLITSRRRLDL